MTAAIGTIDHAVITVPVLDKAAEIYRRLGFSHSPRGVHSAVLGTENHTIMLRGGDYFELLSVRSPTDRNVRWRKSLAEGGGLAGLAMTTTDAAGAYEYWSNVGLSPDLPLKFARPVTRADGTQVEARFEVVSLADVPDTALRVFVCSQPTRDAVWLPELLDHANGAIAIRRISIETPAPEVSAAQWKRILPDVRAATIDNGISLDTGRHAIELRPSVAGNLRATAIDFSVDDMTECESHLRRNTVPYRKSGGRIEVGPDFACNVTIGFEQEAP